MLLGGGSPLEAGAAQLLVLIGLLAAEVLAVRAVTEMVAAAGCCPSPADRHVQEPHSLPPATKQSGGAQWVSTARPDGSARRGSDP